MSKIDRSVIRKQSLLVQWSVFAMGLYAGITFYFFAAALERGITPTMGRAPRVRDQITQIATAVDEQSAASEEVARNIERSSSISHDLEGMSGDVMCQVNELVRIADALKHSTKGFKTKS